MHKCNTINVFLYISWYIDCTYVAQKPKTLSEFAAHFVILILILIYAACNLKLLHKKPSLKMWVFVWVV